MFCPVDFSIVHTLDRSTKVGLTPARLDTARSSSEAHYHRLLPLLYYLSEDKDVQCLTFLPYIRFALLIRNNTKLYRYYLGLQCVMISNYLKVLTYPLELSCHTYDGKPSLGIHLKAYYRVALVTVFYPAC